jgi:hypothetical protein
VNAKMSKKRKSRKESASRSGTRSSSTNIPDDFNPDYTYVKQDLRTIGILAGIFITALVILSFII